MLLFLGIRVPYSPLVLQLDLGWTFRILIDIFATLVWALKEEGLHLHGIWTGLLMTHIPIRLHALQRASSADNDRAPISLISSRLQASRLKGPVSLPPACLLLLYVPSLSFWALVRILILNLRLLEPIHQHAVFKTFLFFSFLVSNAAAATAVHEIAVVFLRMKDHRWPSLRRRAHSSISDRQWRYKRRPRRRWRSRWRSRSRGLVD